MRHTAFITDTPDPDIAGLQVRHRQRARAENVIRDTKACGLANLPFDCVVNNDTWTRLCLAANDLLAWARRITCTGSMAKATPKTIRHRLLSIAGRLTPTGRRCCIRRSLDGTVRLDWLVRAGSGVSRGVWSDDNVGLLSSCARIL